jgi:hypothetical protein
MCTLVTAPGSETPSQPGHASPGAMAPFCDSSESALNWQPPIPSPELAAVPPRPGVQVGASVSPHRDRDVKFRPPDGRF